MQEEERAANGPEGAEMGSAAGTGERKRVPAWPVLLGMVSFAMGQTVLFAVAGPIFRIIGLTETDLGIVVSLAAVAFTVSAPLWGRASDRLGRLNVVTIGLLCYSVFTVLFALVMEGGMSGVLIPLTAFMMMIAVRVVMVLLSAGIQPAAIAFMADSTDESRRGAGVALVGAAFGIGSVMGPVAGGLLSVYGLLVPLYASSALSLLAALLIRLTLSEPARHREQIPARLSFFDKRVSPYFFMALVVFTCVAIVQQTSAFYFQDVFALSAEMTARNVGIAIGVLALAMLVAQGGIVQIFNPAPLTLLRVGAVLYGVAAGAALLAPGLIELFACYALLGLGAGLAMPGLQAGASLSVGPDEQGAAAGIVAAGMGGGYIFGPLAGTALYEVSLSYPFILVAGLTALVFFGALRLPRQPAALAAETPAGP